MRAAIKKKYGFMVTVITVVNKVASVIGNHGMSDAAVIITLD